MHSEHSARSNSQPEGPTIRNLISGTLKAILVLVDIFKNATYIRTHPTVTFSTVCDSTGPADSHDSWGRESS